jgi:hypothetical protein
MRTARIVRRTGRFLELSSALVGNWLAREEAPLPIGACVALAPDFDAARRIPPFDDRAAASTMIE